MPENNKENISGEQPALKDLIDIKEWQRIQDNFSVVTGVGLRTVDVKGTPITLSSGEPRLCQDLLKEPSIKERVCGSCLPTFLGGMEVLDKNLRFMCRAGLHNFFVPLRVESHIFGYTIVGPVILIMRKAKEEYLRTAEELNLDLEEFWSALLEIKVISFQAMQAVVELVKDVAEYTLRLAYQKAVIMREGEVMAPESPKLSKVLKALLDVAFQVTGADIGSIMLLDKANDELTIHTSRGIADEIAQKARVRFGEGISGTAAKEGESFIIDDTIPDNRIKRYMKRPYLSSSMVVPIKVKDSPWGVMNLGALTTSSVRFNIESVQLINKLIGLATVALHD